MELAIGLLGTVVIGVIAGLILADVVGLFHSPLEALVRKLQGAGPPSVGAETLVGVTTTLKKQSQPGNSETTHLSTVAIGNETWTVRLREPCDAGQRVRIVRAGTILDVIPVSES